MKDHTTPFATYDTNDAHSSLVFHETNHTRKTSSSAVPRIAQAAVAMSLLELLHGEQVASTQVPHGQMVTICQMAVFGTRIATHQLKLKNIPTSQLCQLMLMG